MYLHSLQYAMYRYIFDFHKFRIRGMWCRNHFHHLHTEAEVKNQAYNFCHKNLNLPASGNFLGIYANRFIIFIALCLGSNPHYVC